MRHCHPPFQYSYIQVHYLSVHTRIPLTVGDHLLTGTPKYSRDLTALHVHTGIPQH